MALDKIVVIGAGAMGSGIAQVLAVAGYQVTLQDIAESQLQRAQTGIARSLTRMINKGVVPEAEQAAILTRITATTELTQACEGADLVIESVPELLELKQQLFTELDQLCPPACLLASNTSQINISAMAGRTERREQVAGMHWFNPPPMMRLVELIRTPDSSDATIAALTAVAERCGKSVIVVRDGAGFVTSRAFAVNLLEGIRILEEGLASKEDIDTGIKLALGYPMGPLELADYVGLDVVFHASRGMVEAFGDRFRPPQLLVNLVRSGHLGMKTGRGFYRWEQGKKITA